MCTVIMGRMDAYTCNHHFIQGDSSVRDEDDGYLMTLLLDGKTCKSELLIFDARDVTQGEHVDFTMSLSLSLSLQLYRILYMLRIVIPLLF